MGHTITSGDLVKKLGGELVGDPNLLINSVASLETAHQNSISFFNNPKYSDLLKSTKAAVVIVNRDDLADRSGTSIVIDNPYLYFAKVSQLLNPSKPLKKEIHKSAIIHPSCKLGQDIYIGPNVVIDENVSIDDGVVIHAGSMIEADSVIGKASVIHPHVVIKANTVIGKNCTLYAGCVIGSDGFGYAKDDSRWLAIPQIGRVTLGDNVDIGSNSTIDRGALDDTMISSGVKIDNLVQIGHNCMIGENTIIAGCVGIAGSAKIGKNCAIGGAAMILGHLSITDDVTISPGSMITRSIKTSGTYTALMPFQDHEAWLKTAAKIRRLK
ncbi:UDP-3-O-(3-hydroxymyristoyl)glucosamine N-acyltransferase [Candidatus Methylopumilus planktonicus]|uniref:UDP-3-O-(3-hydroxymyristoyl)glucosamine N-acyltransferase n=1 Tax=Candidatus Methylopumilus planktonicus TaxID=1581557 RepID=UPI00111D3C61|nr:UDP-3-O-(3-hydroxymyristoyl)glucosamine N-acyltransferase [Candidatus Methylopumilus planktonicus]QDD06956.1 UDP-3-O-(3-hydroxymyristoyl)glucosamine N-acyltransferase [Candidatus Methylopumilus planktonicus]QDD08289.1 UDP-3-O-(3-hydroxymyristoyl)glucosamine N-acyltransferase [Candidatus Methylopumilus planktonicus]QDD09617.1 UDP-3-O-(3-hydroxymyristoyl)glucosamine N-acyltransferase [Candidatus Methylopumilus planktonicus]